MTDSKKGVKYGVCNSSNCEDTRFVIFFNVQTLKYYCGKCATQINSKSNAYVCRTDDMKTPREFKKYYQLKRVRNSSKKSMLNNRRLLNELLLSPWS